MNPGGLASECWLRHRELCTFALSPSTTYKERPNLLLPPPPPPPLALASPEGYWPCGPADLLVPHPMAKLKQPENMLLGLCAHAAAATFCPVQATWSGGSGLNEQERLEGPSLRVTQQRPHTIRPPSKAVPRSQTPPMPMK